MMTFEKFPWMDIDLYSAPGADHADIILKYPLLRIIVHDEFLKVLNFLHGLNIVSHR